jgi:hypothetical protein
MKQINSGPAFPRIYEFRDNEYENVPGMSLRMYIAVQAMQGFIISTNYSYNEQKRKQLAEKSFLMADEMLKKENDNVD